MRIWLPSLSTLGSGRCGALESFPIPRPDLIAPPVLDLADHLLGQGVGDPVDEHHRLLGIRGAFHSVPRIGQPLVQSHPCGPLLEHGRGVEHPVHKVDFLCRPVAGGRFQVVDRPLRAVHVAGVPVQVLRQHRAPGQPLCHVGVGGNAPPQVGAGRHIVPLPKRNQRCLVPRIWVVIR